jgi:hypothetical protein
MIEKIRFRDTIQVVIIGGLLLSPFRHEVSGPNPRVNGVVTDIEQKSRIPRIDITVEGGGHVYKAQTDGVGSYSVALVPGTYTMQVGSPGWCSMRRGPFVVDDGTTAQFDFQLMVCPSDASGKFTYSELRPAVNSEMKALVLHGDARTEDHVVRYAGPVLPHMVVVDNGSPGPPRRVGRVTMTQITYPVVLTYNLLTIRCTQLTYDQDRRLVTANGEVEVQDETGTRLGARAEVSLIGLRPQVDMTPK